MGSYGNIGKFISFPLQNVPFGLCCYRIDSEIFVVKYQIAFRPLSVIIKSFQDSLFFCSILLLFLFCQNYCPYDQKNYPNQKYKSILSFIYNSSPCIAMCYAHKTFNIIILTGTYLQLYYQSCKLEMLNSLILLRFVLCDTLVIIPGV